MIIHQYELEICMCFDINNKFSSVQFSHVRLFVITWIAAHQDSLSITNSWSLLKLISIESVMPSNHLILSCPLLLLPSIFSSIRVFSNESVLHIRWPKFWSFSFSISLSDEYSGQIFFRMDLVGSSCSPRDSQKSIPIPHFKRINSLVLSFLYSSTLNPYMTTGKTIALTRQTSVSKVMSLLLNMLSRLVIASFLISRLQSPSAVILEPTKIKSITVSIFSSSICHEVMGLDAMIFVF